MRQLRPGPIVIHSMSHIHALIDFPNPKHIDSKIPRSLTHSLLSDIKSHHFNSAIAVLQSRRIGNQQNHHITMSNPLDTDAGSELFSSYEAELKLVQADLNQKLDQITELSGEPRKSAVRLAERSLEEANELVWHLYIRWESLDKRLGISNSYLLIMNHSSTPCASKNKTSPPPSAPA